MLAMLRSDGSPPGLKRVMVIGSPGSGKSSVARAIAGILGEEVTHLDRLWWKRGWIESSIDEFEEALAPILQGDRWIIDGNYTFAMPARVARASLVIWLDPPPIVCVLRVLKRTATNLGRNRPDLAEGCPEHFDLPLLRYIWSYRHERVPLIQKALAGRPPECLVERVRSQSALHALLSNLRAWSGQDGGAGSSAAIERNRDMFRCRD